MNKSDLVTFVASTAGLNKVDSTKAVDSVLYAISKSLSKGEGRSNFSTIDQGRLLKPPKIFFLMLDKRQICALSARFPRREAKRRLYLSTHHTA